VGQEEGGPPSAAKRTGAREFSKQELAYAVALYAAGREHFTETALRRPPKTKRVREGIAVTFADLAEALRVKKPLSDGDLFSGTRAHLLWRTVPAFTAEERREYELEVEAALNTIAARRTIAEPFLSCIQAPETTPGAVRWPRPPITLFHPHPPERSISQDEVRALAHRIQQALAGQKVYADVLEEYINIGNRVLSFGVLPTGIPLKEGNEIVRDPFGAIVYTKETRIAEITRLKADLQARLHAKTIRVLDPVAGEPYVGIEIPNPYPTTVVLRDLLEDPDFQRAHLTSELVIAIGRDLAGRVVYLDLEDPSNPHLLIAGSTGGGKSVCVNTIIGSLLAFYSPEQLRLLMIDPKLVELSLYEGIPHLIGKVLETPEEAVAGLKRAKDEMERRYQLFKQHGVRDIKGYRKLVKNTPTLEYLPSVVVLGDEIAALMEQSKEQKEDLETTPEALFSQIGALGRAAGIHLILCTQRPTVNVITGLIKGNIPARIALMVADRVNSQVILDHPGAEELQGKGDAILQTPEYKSLRTQCALTTDEEVRDLVGFWQSAQPLSGDEGRPAMDVSQIRQQSFLDLPFFAAPMAPQATPAGESERVQAGEQPLEDSLDAYLRGEQLPFALNELDNAELYPFVEAWTRLRPTVTRDEIRIEFGVSQTRAGTMLVLLHKHGVIGEAQSGGRPRQVLVSTPGPVTATVEETSV
jgi:hypothetical protein